MTLTDAQVELTALEFDLRDALARKDNPPCVDDVLERALKYVEAEGKGEWWKT